MGLHTKQHDIFQASAGQQNTTSPTLGIVADTNDPQQMGRVRVVCPQWGDSWNTELENLPWAMYMSPFGGQVQVGTRGPGVQSSDGGVAYGMWAIPKVGSQVVVMCVDGNPMARIAIGCVFDQFTPHTLPHGRFMYDDHPELQKAGDDAKPYGPYTSAETLIQPLSQNLRRAFGAVGEKNYEYRTRGADYTVSRVDVSQLPQTYSKVQDDKDVNEDGWISTQGYQASRQDPYGQSSLTDKNYDSMVYSFTSPGFHSFSMDDRQENCRVRFRTTSGHQIIMDDTNERIYIATAQGNNWIELDQEGNIDVFTTNKLNIHASREINMTSDETVRLYGKKGVHIKSDQDIRVQSGTDVHVKVGANLRLSTGASGFVQTGAAFHLQAGSTVNLQSGGSFQTLAGGGYAVDAPSIDMNSGLAGAASAAADQPAFWTNRVPMHEPWARTMTRTDFTHEPELAYDSKDAGRVERGRVIERGAFWRR